MKSKGKTKKIKRTAAKASSKNKKPKFIVVEGGEASGKSSLLKALKEKFGDKIHITREPGGSPFAEVIRDVALKYRRAKDAPAASMLCLMFAARFDHIASTIAPALEKGQHVITDRFDASSYTYQLHGQESPDLDKLFWELRSRITRLPDLYVYVDVEVEEGMRRASSRNASVPTQSNHFDERKIDFHTRLRTGYQNFFKKVPHVVIDANRSFDKVKADFFKVIKSAIDRN